MSSKTKFSNFYTILAASSTPALSGRSSKSPEATSSLDFNEAQKPINAAQPQPLLKSSNGTNYTTEHSAPVALTTENLTENKLSIVFSMLAVV